MWLQEYSTKRATALVSSSLENNASPAEVKEQLSLKTNTPLRIGSEKIHVAVALTEELRERGLSGVSHINDDEGMLFIFDKPAQYSFWMPDMNFPIDIIWIGTDKKIIDVTKNAQPLTPDEKPIYFKPNKPAQYVLEVNTGFFDQSNLKEGMGVAW